MFIDIIIIFNILVFLGGAINSFNDYQIEIIIIFLLVGFFNCAYLIYIVLLRRNYNKKLEYEVQASILAEEELSEDQKKHTHELKQILLENRIEAELKFKIPEARIIKHAYIPINDGYSEIDFIMITSKGIFVIEVKNLVGKIQGKWTEDQISVFHPNGKTYTMMNPITQNTYHFKALKNTLGMDTKYFRSIIVFGDQTFYDKNEKTPFYAEICKLDDLIQKIDKLSSRMLKSNPLVLEQHIIDSTYETLAHMVLETVDKKTEHKKIVSQKITLKKEKAGTLNE